MKVVNARQPIVFFSKKLTHTELHDSNFGYMQLTLLYASFIIFKKAGVSTF